MSYTQWLTLEYVSGSPKVQIKNNSLSEMNSKSVNVNWGFVYEFRHHESFLNFFLWMPFLALRVCIDSDKVIEHRLLI